MTLMVVLDDDDDDGDGDDVYLTYYDPMWSTGW